MTKLLVVVGSVRRGRAADNILELVQAELKNYPQLEVTVADLKDLPMPFIDSAIIPSGEGFAPEDANVRHWTQLVEQADKVLVITPEYNASTSPALLNAIDWMYHPWQDKPVALIGYGWSGSASGRQHLTDVFNRLKAKVIEPQAGLSFSKEINPDGSVSDQTAAQAAINAVLAQL